MLKLDDFYHLPQLDALVAELVADEPGTIVVAGLDPRPQVRPAAGAAAPATARSSLRSKPPSPGASLRGFLPSGRTTIFRILLHEILAARPSTRAVIVAEDETAVRVPRTLQGRIALFKVEPPLAYKDQIAYAIRRYPGVLVVDRISAENAIAVLEAAQKGLRVLAQMDTVFRGADVLRCLQDWGASPEQIERVAWVVAVQRMATLCPRCKQPVPPDSDQLAMLRRLYPDLDPSLEAFFQPAGCAECRGTGRHGDVAVFDVFRSEDGPVGARGARLAQQAGVFDRMPSLLSLQAYVLHLAAQGYLSIGDVLHLDAEQLRHTYNLLATNEQVLAETNAAMERQLAELQAAYRVLQQRTEALISLQGISQTLIASTELEELGARVCRHACDLCGADRAILYVVREPGLRMSEDVGSGGPEAREAKVATTEAREVKVATTEAREAKVATTEAREAKVATTEAEVCSVNGWDPSLLGQRLDAGLLFGTQACPERSEREDGDEPALFSGCPPGVPPSLGQGVAKMAGLRVPLVAQGRRVGLMIVHTGQKPLFAPGEVALLRTFANQAALAIQRAGLIAQLRDKIAQLEAAQAELVQKERMERELELARQVQQSVLPRVFPQVPGYAFAARNEPARQVGGDFYDVFMLDANHLGLVVADVSGKGMPAALYMALARSLILAEARREGSGEGLGEPSPCAVLKNVNRLLLELGEANMFVTVFYGVVEQATRRLTYARAGHDRPLLLRGEMVRPLAGSGAFLGCLDEGALRLSEERIDLAPGDRLVLYTDGLTDVQDPDGTLFELERLKRLLQSHASLPPAGMCVATFADLLAYRSTAEQFDDMTMLVMEVE